MRASFLALMLARMRPPSKMCSTSIAVSDVWIELPETRFFSDSEIRSAEPVRLICG